jgi:hypothetical protein
VVPGSPVEHEVGTIEQREEISPTTLGLTITEGKALLASLQKQIVTAQVQQHVAGIKSCPQCKMPFLWISCGQLLNAVDEQEPNHPSCDI